MLLLPIRINWKSAFGICRSIKNSERNQSIKKSGIFIAKKERKKKRVDAISNTYSSF